MIQISKNIKVDGFESKEEFEKWLKEQEKIEPNKNVLKTFKYFLMLLEEDAKNNEYNKFHIEALEQYAKKMIDRKIMKKEDVIKFISKAQNL